MTILFEQLADGRWITRSPIVWLGYLTGVIGLGALISWRMTRGDE